MKDVKPFMQGLGFAVGIGLLLATSPQVSNERILGDGVSTGIMDGSKTLIVLGNENTAATLSANEITTSLLLSQMSTHPKLKGCTIATGISPDGLSQIIEWPNGDHVQKVLLWMSLLNEHDDVVDWTYYRAGRPITSNKKEIRKLNSQRLEEINRDGD